MSKSQQFRQRGTNGNSTDYSYKLSMIETKNNYENHYRYTDTSKMSRREEQDFIEDGRFLKQQVYNSIENVDYHVNHASYDIDQERSRINRTSESITKLNQMKNNYRDVYDKNLDREQNQRFKGLETKSGKLHNTPKNQIVSCVVNEGNKEVKRKKTTFEEFLSLIAPYKIEGVDYLCFKTNIMNYSCITFKFIYIGYSIPSNALVRSSLALSKPALGVTGTKKLSGDNKGKSRWMAKTLHFIPNTSKFTEYNMYMCYLMSIIKERSNSGNDYYDYYLICVIILRASFGSFNTKYFTEFLILQKYFKVIESCMLIESLSDDYLASQFRIKVIAIESLYNCYYLRELKLDGQPFANSDLCAYRNFVNLARMCLIKFNYWFETAVDFEILDQVVNMFTATGYDLQPFNSSDAYVLTNQDRAKVTKLIHDVCLNESIDITSYNFVTLIEEQPWSLGMKKGDNESYIDNTNKWKGAIRDTSRSSLLNCFISDGHIIKSKFFEHVDIKQCNFMHIDNIILGCYCKYGLKDVCDFECLVNIISKVHLEIRKNEFKEDRKRLEIRDNTVQIISELPEALYSHEEKEYNSTYNTDRNIITHDNHSDHIDYTVYNDIPVQNAYKLVLPVKDKQQLIISNADRKIKINANEYKALNSDCSKKAIAVGKSIMKDLDSKKDEKWPKWKLAARKRINDEGKTENDKIDEDEFAEEIVAKFEPIKYSRCKHCNEDLTEFVHHCKMYNRVMACDWNDDFTYL